MSLVGYVIDAHHHLWRYSADEYPWIDDSVAVLRRDYLASDLMRELAAAGVSGAVSVQARQTLHETEWLLELARECPMIRGVVGWAPIAAPNFEALLDQFSAESALVGLRHVVQGEPDGFLNGTAFNRGIHAMLGSGLAYDVLILEHQLPEAIRFIDRHPNQIFVLDHMAKPKIASRALEPWRSGLLEIGKRGNVYCKVSGMVTEDSWADWSMESLRPYLDCAVEAFGAYRLMAGSDWPVCLVATKYRHWWNVLDNYFSKFSAAERLQIFCRTALQAYGLDDGGGQ